MADIDPIGSQTRVNSFERDTQSAPSIARLSDGSSVVVWQSNGQDGDSGGI